MESRFWRARNASKGSLTSCWWFFFCYQGIIDVQLEAFIFTCICMQTSILQLLLKKKKKKKKWQIFRGNVEQLCNYPKIPARVGWLLANNFCLWQVSVRYHLKVTLSLFIPWQSQHTKSSILKQLARFDSLFPQEIKTSHSRHNTQT